MRYEAEAIVASEEMWEMARGLILAKGLDRMSFSHQVRLIEERLVLVVKHRLQFSAPSGDSFEWKHYTTAEVADLVTRRRRPVQIRTVRQWIRQGRLEAGWDRTPNGRGVCRLISPRSVEALLSGRLPPAGKFKNPPVDDQKPEHLDMLLKKDGNN